MKRSGVYFLLLLVLLAQANSARRVQSAPEATAPALVSIGVSPNPVPASGVVTFTTIFTDPQGAGDIRRYFFGFSDCPNTVGEAYAGNFERRFANFFGAFAYTAATPSVAYYNDPNGCSGGQYGATAWKAGLPGANRPGTATLLGRTESVSGSNLRVDWTVQLTNFPAGTYNTFYMVEDLSYQSQTGGTSEWWRGISFSVANLPPTATPTGTPPPTPTRTPSPTFTPTATLLPSPTPTPNHPPALLALSLDHQPAYETDVITVTQKTYDPQGGASLQRVQLGISDCPVAQGETGNSNFERRLADFFGGIHYPTAGGRNQARLNSPSACTGGKNGVNPWSSKSPWINAPGTLIWTEGKSVIAGNTVVTTWVLRLADFPPGVYGLYWAARDAGKLWQTGSTAGAWTRHPQTFEVLPPPQPAIEGVWLSGRADPEIEIAQGSSFRLKVQAANLASPHGVGENASLSISFPGQAADFLAHVSPLETGGFTYAERAAAPRDPTVTFTRASWPGGLRETVELLITPQQAGPLTIHIKAVMHQGPNRYAAPQSGVTLDQAGDRAVLRSVTVLDLVDPLSRVNYYRSLAGLAPVSALPAWNEACRAHSRYMAVNNLLTHHEDPARPEYTLEGAAAGQAGNLALFQTPDVADLLPVDRWMASAFHGLQLLEPRWLQSGFGSYSTSQRSAACLDVARGVDFLAPADWPVRWPAAGGTTPFLEYGGGATPDPLAACPGYTAPAGPPVFLLTGPGIGLPHLTAYSLSGNGQPLESCAFSETTYTHPDPGQQSAGRAILGQRDAVVLLPRQPFQTGVTYTASLTVDGVDYAWSFQVAPGFLANNLPGAVAGAGR